MKELYDPVHDGMVIEGNPVHYYDFEFEQYTLNKDILREMVLDEIIMANSKEARALNRQLREKYPKGVLEQLYERQETQKNKSQPIVMEDSDSESVTSESVSSDYDEGENTKQFEKKTRDSSNSEELKVSSYVSSTSVNSDFQTPKKKTDDEDEDAIVSPAKIPSQFLRISLSMPPKKPNDDGESSNSSHRSVNPMAEDPQLVKIKC